MLNQSTPILKRILKGLTLLLKTIPIINSDPESPEMKIQHEFCIKEFEETNELICSINGELSKRKKDEQSE